jgi:hypothetical protein
MGVQHVHNRAAQEESVDVQLRVHVTLGKRAAWDSLGARACAPPHTSCECATIDKAMVGIYRQYLVLFRAITLVEV